MVTFYEGKYVRVLSKISANFINRDENERIGDYELIISSESAKNTKGRRVLEIVIKNLSSPYFYYIATISTNISHLYWAL